MSQEIQTSRAGMRIIALYVGVPVLLLIGLLIYMLSSTSPSDSLPKDPTKPGRHENHLASVRATLAKQNDLAVCKSLIPQLNAHLQQEPHHAPPKLSDKDREWLRQQAGLNADDVTEVAGPAFTPLDAHHIATCFLLRDAARFMELAPPGGRGGTIKQTPLDRATLAFAWVMRQVRLQPARQLAEPWTEPIPPSFVLRRGWGTDLERALVFLSLLEQFGLQDDASAHLQGALLFKQSATGEKSLWCCGVAIGEQPDALYLFDPRLGLPIPGPGGKGVATLGETLNNKEVLGQLRVDRIPGEDTPTDWWTATLQPVVDQLQADLLRYDMTAEQARDAEVCLYCPLSALAPRMALLQDRLLREPTWKDQALPAPVRVRLAEDAPRAVALLQQAVKKSGGKADRVKVWPQGAAILRRFLPEQEGGVDVDHPFLLRQVKGFTTDTDPSRVRMTRERLYKLEVAPWQDFPQVFHLSDVFGASTSLGQQLRNIFGLPFIRPILEPGSTRDLILRGRPGRAAPDLVRDQEHWQQMGRRRLEAVNLMAGLGLWADKAVEAYAQLQRAKGTGAEGAAMEQVNVLWKPGEAGEIVLLGAVAEGAAAEATYQLGLCKHEVAARLQARKELAARGGIARQEDTNKAIRAWKDAEGYWREYVETYRGRPWVASAQLHRGEAQAHSGETKEAIRTWQDIAAPNTNLQRLARLWLAKRLAQRP